MSTAHEDALVEYLDTRPLALETLKLALVEWEARLLKLRDPARLRRMIITGDWPCNADDLNGDELAGRALRVWYRFLYAANTQSPQAVLCVAHLVAAGELAPEARDLPLEAA